MPNEDWAQTSIALTHPLKAWLQAYAKRHDLSVSQAVRRALTLLMREESAESTSAESAGENAAD